MTDNFMADDKFSECMLVIHDDQCGFHKEVKLYHDGRQETFVFTEHISQL